MEIPYILQQRVPLCAVPYVNCGGCGIFALGLHKMLEKLGEKSSIIVSLYGSEEISDFRENPTPESSPTLRHVMVLYDGDLYDSTGCVDRSEYPDLVEITKEELKIFLKAGWNPMFNRKKHTGKIMKGFNQIVKEFKTKDYESR